MSWKVLNWVADQSPTKGAARLLLVMMADMANDDGEFYCTNAHLAGRCNVSVRALQISMRALERSGAIRVISQAADSGRSLNNAYEIITPGRVAPQLRSKSPRVKVSSPSPESEPTVPRVKVSSPSPATQNFTLRAQDPSPSPCKDLHPHKETQTETTNRNETEQQQQPRAPEGVRPRPFEDVEALKANIEQAVKNQGEWGWSFDRMALYITSGAVTGRKVCRGTLSFETMSDKHMRRSLVDSVTLLNKLGAQAEA